jgi:hypothetical protein
MSGITKAGSIRQGPGTNGLVASMNSQVAWMLAAVRGVVPAQAIGGTGIGRDALDRGVDGRIAIVDADVGNPDPIVELRGVVHQVAHAQRSVEADVGIDEVLGDLRQRQEVRQALFLGVADRVLAQLEWSRIATPPSASNSRLKPVQFSFAKHNQWA